MFSRIVNQNGLQRIRLLTEKRIRGDVDETIDDFFEEN